MTKARNFNGRAALVDASMVRPGVSESWWEFRPSTRCAGRRLHGSNFRTAPDLAQDDDKRNTEDGSTSTWTEDLKLDV